VQLVAREGLGAVVDLVARHEPHVPARDHPLARPAERVAVKLRRTVEPSHVLDVVDVRHGAAHAVGGRDEAQGERPRVRHRGAGGRAQPGRGLERRHGHRWPSAGAGSIERR
jgi:hypothetical protein